MPIQSDDLQQKLDALQQENSQLKKEINNKQNIIANFNHEVRTPANTILGLIELIFDESDAEKTEAYLQKVKDSCLQLRSVTDNIRDFTNLKDTASMPDEDLFRFSPVRIVESILTEYAERAKSKNNILSLTFDSSVHVDFSSYKDACTDILVQLIDNAIKFTEQGDIQLSLSFNDDDVALQFSVKDTGIGISLEKQNEVFKPYEQEDNSATREYAGLGLGLTISRTLAEKLGGRLVIDPSYEDGTLVTLSMPATPQVNNLIVAESAYEPEDAFIVCCQNPHIAETIVSYLDYNGASDIKVCTPETILSNYPDTKPTFLVDGQALKQLISSFDENAQVILFDDQIVSKTLFSVDLSDNSVNMPFTSSTFFQATSFDKKLLDIPVLAKAVNEMESRRKSAVAIDTELLLSYLKEGDYNRSVTELDKLKMQFEQNVKLHTFEQIRDAIEDFDFSTALSILERE